MSASSLTPDVRAQELFLQEQRRVGERTDRNFACLMTVQYLFGIVAALTISPLTWNGSESETHIHVTAAIFLGGLITSVPVFLAVMFPGRQLTRHVVAVGQMLMGALLIHLTGGRIETHFHVFGSLAFLAFYRDWKVLVTATAVVGIDHFMRGMFWPLSVFGVDYRETYRWLEHVGWVLFEDLFLLVSIHQWREQSWTLAQRQCDLEAAKAEVESERDQFFDLSVDLLCVANLEGYFVRLNPMFSVKLGYSNEELLSRPLLEFVHPDDRTATVDVIEQLRQGLDIQDFENRYRCSDGTYIWLAWSSRIAGESDLLYAVGRDVSVRKLEAQALKDARQSAEDARAHAEDARLHAEEANRAKSDFLANMSHEIRTPMNAVIGLTELVLETELTLTQKDYLTTVLESGESLLTIINEILDFSKIEAGKIELEFEPFNVRDEIGDMMKSIGVRAHRKQLELVWRAEPDVPRRVIGDAARLRQILINLTGNAIKFTEEGEVVLDVRCLGVKDNRAELMFQLRDTGIGIPPEKIQSVFGEFEQADTSTTREFGGTGLGLSISSRLTELMGGKIKVKSNVGEGSVFTFTLSFEVAEDQDDASKPELEWLQDHPVIIVDDNPTNRLILEEITLSWGMCPTTFGDARDALKYVREEGTPEKTPLVVLTDINMPNMDGFTFASELRRDRSNGQAVIIALTSGGRIGDAERRGAYGISSELLKPVKQSELLDAIVHAIAPLAEQNLGEDSSTANLDLPPLRILLAEDGLTNQKLAVGLLQKWGHEVTVAADGNLAIEQWESKPFDLILMDLQMPTLDGIAATEIIRRREGDGDQHIPIIAMTAHALKGDRERCLDAGMDGYVSKPVRKQELADAMRELFVHVREQ